MKKRRVVWTIKAATSFREHLNYLNQRSPRAAAKVRAEILKSTRSLQEKSEIFQLDEYRADPNQNVRRFFRWHYKIVYQVLNPRL